MVKERTFNAEVISGGRITIPEKTREVLNITEGDILSVTVSKEEHKYERQPA